MESPPAPLFTVHATGLAARPVSPTAAAVVLYNAGVQAIAVVTREELAAMAEQLGKLAETLEDAPPAGPQLIVPEGAGSVVRPPTFPGGGF